MRKMYSVLSFSFVVFSAVLCIDFLLTGLFVGFPKNEFGWIVVWIFTAVIAIFLLVLLCMYGTPSAAVLFIIFLLIFTIRVVRKNNDFARIYENLPETNEFFGYAVSYPLRLHSSSNNTQNDGGFYFMMKVTKVRSAAVFVPVKPFILQINCRNAAENTVLCWGTYRVTGRIKPDKSVYFMSKNSVGRINAKKIIPVNKFAHPMLKVGAVRAELLNRLENKLSPQSFAFVAALFFGNRSYIEPEMMENWRRSGLAYLLAVSGFHVGVLAVAVRCFLRRFFSRTVSSICTSVVLIIFGLFLNTSVSSLRAILMCFMLMMHNEAGINCGRQHIMSCAGIILLFANPYIIYDYGFILSFSAVAGILLFADKIIPMKKSAAPVFRSFASAAAVCIAAFCSTALFQCSLFGQLPLFSAVTSMFVCLLFSCVFVFLLVCILLIVSLPNADFFCISTDWVSRTFLEIIKLTEKIPPLKIGNVPLYMGFLLFIAAFFCLYIALPMYSVVKRKIAFGKLKKSS